MLDNVPSLDREADAIRSKTILVVDDDALICLLIQQILSREGFKVVLAADGLEAQRMALKHPNIQLLITDFHIPYLNGVELAAWFQQHYPETKILLISSAPDDVAAYDLELGSTLNLLPKPFTRNGLLDQVNCLLSEGVAA